MFLKKRNFLLGSMLAAFTIAACGCAKAEDLAEDAVVVVSGEGTGNTYTLEEVKRGEVVLSKSLTCVYVQERSRKRHFRRVGS